MGGVVSLIIVIWVVVILVKKTKDSQPVTSKRPVIQKGALRPQGFTGYKPHKDITSVSRDMGDARNSSVLRDDRTNDWLAKQLREEHRAFKATSEMFDLKIEHASHCDARILEQFHKKHCDASGIDLANGKTIIK